MGKVMVVCACCESEFFSTHSCTIESLEFVPSGTLERIKYKIKTDQPICYSCGVADGGVHHCGCEAEECPGCYEQLISCYCMLEGEQMDGNLLVLEDHAGRNAHFRAAYPEATIVETAHEAIDALQKQAWDHASLDHDLGGEIFVDSSRSDCGMEVVRWIIENKPSIKQIIVHTANRGASDLMCKALRATEYDVIQAPFGGRFDPRG
jgi:hypothetical protein